MDLIQQYLMDRFNVTSATSGREAISRLAKDFSVNLIVLDHNLPDRSGIEVLQQVKKIRSSIPVIMMTAYGSEEVAADAFRNGAGEYLKKPFSKNELVEKIDFCLSMVSNFATRKISTSAHEEITFNLVSRAKPKSKIQKAVSYINENFESKLTLGVVADKACMSRYHFSRSFKEEVGCTYQDYVNNIRINKAVEMLSEGSLTITDIAFSVGFCDLSHFTRIFRKNMGFTPTNYRKKLLKN